MFQVAATIATSLKYKIPYCIPKHTLNDKVWKPYYFENVNYCDDKMKGVSCIYNEKSHAYNEIPPPACDNLILNGYFQSEKYFKYYLPEIRKAFGFDYSIKNKGVVALHHRLGDYKLYMDKHVILSGDYIEKSLRYLSGLGYNKCLVFSDEINECESIINSEKYPMWEIGYSVGRNELEDLQEMIGCECFIISASTFSLMASILSESENKICIAPLKWFEYNNSHLDTKDVVPENYIRL